MGNYRALSTIAVLTLGACGGSGETVDAAIVIVPDAPIDAKVIDAPPDAPAYDFSCVGNTVGTAMANVTVSGAAQEVVINGQAPSIQAAVGVAIKACKGNCANANLLDMQTSAAGGVYTTNALATQNMPLDGYLDATKTGNQRTLVFPPSPLVANTPNVPILMFSNTLFGLVQQVAGAQADPAKGTVALAITDCAMTPIATGATISVKQNGTAVAGTTEFDLGSAAAQAAGTYLVFNVPAGATEVNATVNGMTFRAHLITSVAGATTETIIRPGF